MMKIHDNYFSVCTTNGSDSVKNNYKVEDEEEEEEENYSTTKANSSKFNSDSCSEIQVQNPQSPKRKMDVRSVPEPEPASVQDERFGGSLKLTDFSNKHEDDVHIVTENSIPLVDSPTSACQITNDSRHDSESLQSTNNPNTLKHSRVLRWKNSWTGKSSHEKNLWLGIFCLLLVTIGLLISLAIIAVCSHDNSDVCLTPDCVMTARQVLSSMDKEVEPCKDFYKFACGSWIRDNKIPDANSNWDQFDVLREKMNSEIKSLLESDPIPSDPKAVLVAQKIYKMCISQDNKDNHTELRRLVDDVVQSGPFMHPDDLGTALGRIRREASGNYLLSLYVFYDEKEPKRTIIYIDQPTIGVAAPHYLNPKPSKFVSAYEELITDSWPFVFPEETDSARIAREIINFEHELAQIVTPMEKRRNRTTLYNPMNLEQLVEIMPQGANWHRYFQEVFKDSNLNIDWSNMTIIVKDVPYFKALDSVLHRTDYEVLRNYFKWRIIFQVGNAVSTKFQQRIFLYLKSTSGIQNAPPKWKICSEWVNRNMGWAVSYRYVQTNFKENFKYEVDSIVKDIREGFYDILQEADWIASETKRIAYKKAQAMQAFIAYPDWLLNDPRALNDEFKGLLSEDFDKNHFDNFLKVTKWSNAKSLKELGKEKDYSKWISYSTVVNAFYSASYNAIAFPAGILQIPFYGFPIQSMNYGGIGAVIGHEISHGFDDEGSQSDEKGRLINWWDDGTMKRYSKKAKCFVEQYGNFSVPELNTTLNGINTLGENIADNGGLRQAFRGYKAYVRRNGEEKRLPGVDFSPDQLFFIAFAQSLCGSYRLENLQQQISTSRHSPWNFQVQGSVANSLEFAHTFNCPIPKSFCQIW